MRRRLQCIVGLYAGENLGLISLESVEYKAMPPAAGVSRDLGIREQTIAHAIERTTA